MNYLLDTNVVSEWREAEADGRVRAWFASVSMQTLHLSVVTVAETRFGAELLPDGRRKRDFLRWIDHTLIDWFGERLLPVDERVAAMWGVVCAASSAAGRPPKAMDGLIAATAYAHGMTVVTRDVSDFEGFGLPMLNPWHDV